MKNIKAAHVLYNENQILYRSIKKLLLIPIVLGELDRERQWVAYNFWHLNFWPFSVGFSGGESKQKPTIGTLVCTLKKSFWPETVEEDVLAKLQAKNWTV